MRIAVLADLHANYNALQSILRHADALKVNNFWFAGDVLGRGEDPLGCLELLRQRIQPEAWVVGNHDAAAVGRNPFQKMGQPPQITEPNEYWWRFKLKKVFGFQKEEDETALRRHWAALQRQSEALAFIRALPLITRPHPNRPDCWLSHGGVSGQSPVITYVRDSSDARLEFFVNDRRQSPWRCLVLGHTHVPALFIKQPQAEDAVYWIGFQHDRPFAPDKKLVYGQPYSLGQGPVIINPGSAGNSRDGDRRPAYAILNTEPPDVTFYRVAIK